VDASPSDTRIVLASGSPRRRELVRALTTTVETTRPDHDEGQPLDGESAQQFVLRQSQAKARETAGRVGEAVIIAADTTVSLDGRLLGKPANSTEATAMLRMLRGRRHAVVTGITALDSRSGRCLSRVRSTDVLMRPYADWELEAYVASGEPLDKAGAYAVQDETFHPAHQVEGCYLNVVGLPLCELGELLEAMGIQSQVRHDWPFPADCLECPLAQRREVVSA